MYPQVTDSDELQRPSSIGLLIRRFRVQIPRGALGPRSKACDGGSIDRAFDRQCDRYVEVLGATVPISKEQMAMRGDGLGGNGCRRK